MSGFIPSASHLEVLELHSLLCASIRCKKPVENLEESEEMQYQEGKKVIHNACSGKRKRINGEHIKNESI